MDTTATNPKRRRKSGKSASGSNPSAPKKQRNSKKKSAAAAAAAAASGSVETMLEVVVPNIPTPLPSTPSCCQTLVVLLDGRDCSVEMPILKDISTVAFCDATSVAEIHEKVLNDARGIFLWDKIQLAAEDLEKFRALKIIVKVGPGVDNIDLEAAGDMGIAVCHVNDDGIEEAADTTLGLILDLYRKINWFDKMAKQGKEFRNFETILEAGGGNCVRIRGDTLGLIGLGRVGVAVALRAKVFGFNVIFYDPYLEDGVEKSYGLTRMYTLADLLGQSDCVSVHCGLNAQNANIINQFTIKNMRSGAFLVNVSNSRLVEETALAVALKDGTLQGAALNTFGYDLVRGPLKGVPNLTCNPNSAFLSRASLVQFRETAAYEMRRGIIDLIPGTLRYLVNRVYLNKAGMPCQSTPSPPGVPPNFNGDYYAAAANAAVVTASAKATSSPQDITTTTAY